MVTTLVRNAGPPSFIRGRVLDYLRASTVQRRVVPSPVLLGPSGGAGQLGGVGVRRARADRQAKETRRTEMRETLENELTTRPEWKKPWSGTATEQLGTFLTGCLFLVAKWYRDSGVLEEEKRQDRPVSRWGPFRVHPLGNGTRDEMVRWMHAMLRVMVTLVASTWLRFADTMSSINHGREEVVVLPEALRRLRGNVVSFLEGLLALRWEADVVRTLLWPRDTRLGFVSQPAKITMATFARYVDQVVGGGEGRESSWLESMTEWMVGSKGRRRRDEVQTQIFELDAIACKNSLMMMNNVRDNLQNIRWSNWEPAPGTSQVIGHHARRVIRMRCFWIPCCYTRWSRPLS